ncbi:hypothetical protein [Halonotius roseus]|uniref:Uncharacterized protein n=1 Tax=Halonotius roseus TaxID=2511997 RepID=A0A544QQ53_9EURY|nr:hypothetical protein [Halonotius roseus]TQQ81575.1 hypothetical protein EWF95_01125 [Halonotius roseus]
MDTTRSRLAVGILIAMLLTTSGLLPLPIAASPYETTPPAPYLHQAVPDTSDRFDRLTAEYGFNPDDAVDASSLPPASRQVVERTVAGSPDADGWYRYELPVCVDGVLVCDSAREPPSAFTYGTAPPAEIFTIVAVDGDQYLFQTGVQPGADTTGDLRGQSVGIYTWLAGLLPLGVLVGAAAVIGHHSDRRRVANLVVGLGGVVLAVGLVVPYLVVTDVVAYDAIAWPLFGAVLGAVGVALVGVAWLAAGYAGTTGTTPS